MAQPSRNFCFSERSPQFFKVFLPKLSSQRLQIPPEFVKYFKGVLPYKSTITSPEGRSWEVELNKVNDHLYFYEGWDQFAQDNSLAFGDFLIFCYGGDAKFGVKIYGKNGCLKELSIPGATSLPEENETVERRKSMALQEEDRDLKDANKFTSEFPFFKKVMNISYINGGCMKIPASFINIRMEKNRHSATLVASDKSWPVKLIRLNGRYAYAISEGWRAFSRGNSLEVDDVCVFELIEVNDFVFKVSIFRCVD